jgi:hypothetical protein
MALQGRNPKEALGNFLASIGDIQRQHEVYAMENQRELDRQAALKSQLETEAMNRTLAGNRNVREQGDYDFTRTLDPFKRNAAELEPRRIQADIDQSGAATESSKAQTGFTNKQSDVFGRDNAPGGIIQRTREADIEASKAQAGSAGAAAAASRANIDRLNREAENEMYLQYTPYDDKHSLWEAIQMGERGLPGGIDRNTSSLISAALRGQDPDTVEAIMKQPWIIAMLPPDIQEKVKTAAATQTAVNPGGKPAAPGYTKPKG